MQKVFYISLILALRFTLPAIGQTPFDGGSGAEANPYTISTAAQLAQLATLVNEGNDAYNDKHYRLVADIDLSDYGAEFNNGQGWIPIGVATSAGLPTQGNPFRGIFDGAGKTISGLYINNTDLFGAGLFGFMNDSAVVKNLAIVDAYINVREFAGIVAGFVGPRVTSSASLWNGGGSRIINCYTSGEIIGGNAIGGIAGGVFLTCSIANSYSSSAVIGTTIPGWTGGSFLGGIAGTVHGVVINCYSTGSVSGTSAIGGIAGDLGAYNNNRIINSAALNPSITASTNGSIGRIVGALTLGVLSGNRALSYIGGNNWNIAANTHNSNNGANISTQQATSAAFWTNPANWSGDGWDADIWAMEDGKLPVLKNVGGKQTGEYWVNQKNIDGAQISFASNIFYTGSLQIPDVMFAGTTLTKDVDYTITVTSIDNIGTSAGANPGLVTVRIDGAGEYSGAAVRRYRINKISGGAGTQTNPIQISSADMLIELRNMINSGGYDANIYIKLMNDVDMTGINWTPMGTISVPFIGEFDGNGKTITGLNINRTANYTGLFGVVAEPAKIYNLAIENVNVVASGYTGVIAGLLNGGIITDCHVSGGTVTGSDFIGGIAGLVDGGSIENSYTTVAVAATGSNVGGIAGRVNAGSITNCVAMNPSVKSTTGLISYTKLDRSDWTFPGYVDNSHNGTIGYSSQAINEGVSPNGRVIALLDGNSSTFWHARWGSPASDYPHWFIVDLGEVVEFSGVMLQRRQDHSGTSIGYRLYTCESAPTNQNDPVNGYAWVNQGEFPFVAGINDEQVSLLQNTVARYVKVYFDVHHRGTTQYAMFAEFALVKELTLDPNAKGGRITGHLSSSGILSNNYAWDELVDPIGEISWINKTLDGIDGADVSMQTARTALFWTATMGWDANVWTIANDTFPVLKTSEPEVPMPVLVSVSHNSITVNAPVSQLQFAISANNSLSGQIGEWQTGVTFANLSSLTDYYIFARSTGAVPVMSEALHVKTGKISQGAGTQDDPVLITTAVELAELAEIINNGKLANNVHVKLMNNIDLSEYGENTNFGQGWTPISSFSGVFDGNGKKISGLYMNYPSLTNIGFFRTLNNNGAVRNLGIVDANVTGGATVGIIVGALGGDNNADRALVLASYVTGSVSGGNNTGGIAGRIAVAGNRIWDCYSYSTVNGVNFVGGIVGSVSSNGEVIHSYSKGAVNGTSYVGGITGTITGNAIVAKSYTTSAVKGERNIGGISGGANNGIIINSAALNSSISGSLPTNVNFGSVSGEKNGVLSGIIGNRALSFLPGNDGIDMTLEEATLASFWLTDANWETTQYVIGHQFWSSNQWTIENGKLPILTNVGGEQSGEFWYIKKSVEYAQITYKPEVFYTDDIIIPEITLVFADDELTLDVDYTLTITSVDSEVTSAGINPGVVSLSIQGIGTYSGAITKEYTIIRMGAGAGTIANPLQITTAEMLAQLAILLNSNRIDSEVHVKLMNDIDLSEYSSGTGWTPIGNINFPFKGNFDGNGKKITGLYINTNTGNYFGLFGIVREPAKIHSLSVEGANINGNNYVGGIAGYMDGGEITNCFVTGVVNGVDYVGGIAGYVTNSASITNCYATCAVKGNTNNVGGIAGFVSSTGFIAFNAALNSTVSGFGELVALDRSNWTFPGYVEASQTGTIGYSSQATNEGAAPNGRVIAMLDGNAQTYWHASWSPATNYPHWFIVDLGEVVEFNGVSVQNRHNNGGSAIGFRLYTTEDLPTNQNDPINGYNWVNQGEFSISGAMGNIGLNFLSNQTKARFAMMYFDVHHRGTGQYAMIAEFALGNGAPKGSRVANSEIAGTFLSNHGLTTLEDAYGNTDTWANKTLTGADGADMTMQNAQTASFWTTAANWSNIGVWNTDVWSIVNGSLPTLRTITPTVEAPQLVSVTHNSIAISHTVENAEFAISTSNSLSGQIGGWQTDMIFTGLNVNTIYYIFARVENNDVYILSASLQALTDESEAPAVISVTVLPSTATVLRGDSRQFTATVETEGNASEEITWSVSGQELISTNIDAATGLLTISPNEIATTLTVTATSVFDNTVFGTATVNVVATAINVASVTLNKPVLTLETGASEQLTATVLPLNATNPAIIWSSSVDSVATVDQNGNVTAVSAGTAIITVVTQDGFRVANCIVSVTQPLQVSGTTVVEGTIVNVSVTTGGVVINLYIQISFIKSDGLDDYVLVASTTPNANGDYVFQNLPEGVYRVQVVTEEFGTAISQAIDLTDDANTTANVNFTVNENAQEITPETPIVRLVTSVSEFIVSELNVYPNPFTDAVRISGADGNTLRVINSAGAIVYTQNIENPDETVGLENLPSGIYILSFEKDGEVKTLRVVKE